MTILRLLGPGERILFTRQSPLGLTAWRHLIASGDTLLLASTNPKVPSERVMPVPMRSVGWIVDAIARLLGPATAGCAPPDQMAVDAADQQAPLRVRRAAQVEAPDEPGISVIAIGRRTFGGGGFDEITWSDRMLFDAGLYRALVGIAVDWARATGQEGPLDPEARIRPHWMGRRIGDTPPPPPAE